MVLRLALGDVDHAFFQLIAVELAVVLLVQAEGGGIQMCKPGTDAVGRQNRCGDRGKRLGDPVFVDRVEGCPERVIVEILRFDVRADELIDRSIDEKALGQIKSQTGKPERT